MDTSSTVSLNYILASVKNYLQVDDKQDEYFMQLIIDCITDLNIFHVDISGSKTVVLPVTVLNTVDLPSDFIDYIKIGMLVNNKITSLSLNENLAMMFTEDCGEETTPNIQTLLDYPVEHHYGVGGGYNIGEYKIDKRNHRIVINGTIPGGQVVMEYVSSGVCADTVVPRYAVPAIRAYVLWQRIDNDPRVPLNEKERKNHIYVTEMRRLKEFASRLTVDEIMDALYRGMRQGIKR